MKRYLVAVSFKTIANDTEVVEAETPEEAQEIALKLISEIHGINISDFFDIDVSEEKVIQWNHQMVQKQG